MANSVNDNEKSETGDGGDRTGRPCAICGKPAIVRYRPFCSRRCADVDLGRWLSGTYAVPAAPDEAEDDEGLEDEPRER